MRYKPEHKQETHRKIVESVSKEFRTHGFDGLGIAKLMGALNLTHGGFYAHFTDKEELVAEACASVFDEMLEIQQSAFETGGLPAVLDYYLSEGHRDHPELGCLLPTLAAEVARHSPETRKTFTEKASAFFDKLAEQMPGEAFEQRRSNVYFLFSAMAGAVSQARAVSDPNLSRAILDSTRDHLLRLFSKDAKTA